MGCSCTGKRYVGKMGLPKTRGCGRLDVFGRPWMRKVVREGRRADKRTTENSSGAASLCKAEPPQDTEPEEAWGVGPIDGPSSSPSRSPECHSLVKLPAGAGTGKRQINFLKRQGHPPRTKSPIGRCNAKVPSQM